MLRRFRHLFHRDKFTIDLNEEMRFHVELRARKLHQQGISSTEARYMARRQFGNYATIQDASTQLWGWTAWERLFQDFRLGARTLAKAPGFTAVAVLTLALGLGINVAVFSVVNAVMLRSLPYPEPGRLISLWEEQTDFERLAQFSSRGTRVGEAGGPRRSTVSVANLLDYRRATVFEGLAAYDFTPMNLTGNGTPERLTGEGVTAGFFEVLGVPLAIGRSFQAEDDHEGANPVVIITDAFWQRRLGGDTNVLTRTVSLDGKPRQIIGVLPKSFASPAQFGLKTPIEFYVPAAYPADLFQARGDHEVNVVGRLKARISPESAQAALDPISASLGANFPKTNHGTRAVIRPLHEDLVTGVRGSLLALLGASGLIVLITCTNVANLLLVRAVARRHESSVRLALGASRFRMVRQFLAESLLLAGAGCIAGIILGRALMSALIAFAPATIPQVDNITMDWRVFAVCTLVATLTGLIFGITPAWQASQTQPIESLKSTARQAGGKSSVRWRTVLTVVEVALSMILLVGAGLLLKSFVLLMGVKLGFQPDRVLVMNIALPASRYTTQAQRFDFFSQLEDRVKLLPGVVAVSTSNRMPMRGGWSTGINIDLKPTETHDCDSQAVTSGYFETLGISLQRGRLFTPADRVGGQFVAVVNPAFGRRLLNDQDPIGRSFHRGPGTPWITIVGIVNDVRRSGKAGHITPQIYLPAAQSDIYPVRLADFAVRTVGEPRQMLNAIQSQVWSIDKDQPITTVRTMEEVIDASVSQRRFQTLLLVVFAGVAVGLAVVGIFGVLSYSVTQRTSELGLRMALGAQPRNILSLVVKEAAMLVTGGVALGLAGAYALTRYLEAMLFGIQRTDAITYLGAMTLLATIAVIASLIPARRGSRVDPIVALRYE